jgi:hypothetical protein
MFWKVGQQSITMKCVFPMPNEKHGAIQSARYLEGGELRRFSDRATTHKHNL